MSSDTAYEPMSLSPKIKEMQAVGVSLGTAIRECLPITIRQFSQRYGLIPTDTSTMINLNARASDALVRGLSTELGGTPDEWRLLLWEAAKPEVSPAAESAA